MESLLSAMHKLSSLNPGVHYSKVSTCATYVGMNRPISIKTLIKKINNINPHETGQIYVTLTQHRGDDWYIYEGESPDPLAIFPTHNAIITKVENRSNYEFSLAHNWSVFIIFSKQTSLSDFNGMEVKGSWTAQIGGSRNNAPYSFSIVVSWKSP